VVWLSTDDDSSDNSCSM